MELLFKHFKTIIPYLLWQIFIKKQAQQKTRPPLTEPGYWPAWF